MRATLVPSTVISAKATDTSGSLLGKISEQLCGETVEKVTISSSSKADSHVVPLGVSSLIAVLSATALLSERMSVPHQQMHFQF